MKFITLYCVDEEVRGIEFKDNKIVDKHFGLSKMTIQFDPENLKMIMSQPGLEVPIKSTFICSKQKINYERREVIECHEEDDADEIFVFDLKSLNFKSVNVFSYKGLLEWTSLSQGTCAEF